MSMKKVNLAVVGATGMVGNQMITCLEERDFPTKDIKLLASKRSEGKELNFKGEAITVEELTEKSFVGVDIALFSAGAGPSKHFAPIAAKEGCVVIDNSSAWREDPEIPLVVPEVNPHALADYAKRNIIANPNCSTIQMVVALNPIHKKYNIKRIVVSTYQAVSGTGVKAVEELNNQTKAVFNNEDCEKSVYPHNIAFNCLPHIDVFLDNGYTKEEMKMVKETRKIMEDDGIRITATTVRVPVINGHSESINIQTRSEITAQDVKNLLENAPGVKVQDDPANNIYPMAINATGSDLTFVGRIRDDDSAVNAINMWVVADNIRKGAASNTVQIAEIIIKDYLL